MSKNKAKKPKKDVTKSIHLLIQIMDNFIYLKGNVKIINTFYHLSLKQQQGEGLDQFIIWNTLQDLESELIDHERWLTDLLDSLKNITNK